MDAGQRTSHVGFIIALPMDCRLYVPKRLRSGDNSPKKKSTRRLIMSRVTRNALWNTRTTATASATKRRHTINGVSADCAHTHAVGLQHGAHRGLSPIFANAARTPKYCLNRTQFLHASSRRERRTSANLPTVDCAHAHNLRSRNADSPSCRIAHTDLGSVHEGRALGGQDG